MSTGNSRRGRDTDRAHGVLPDEVNRLLDKWAIGHVMVRYFFVREVDFVDNSQEVS